MSLRPPLQRTKTKSKEDPCSPSFVFEKFTQCHLLIFVPWRVQTKVWNQVSWYIKWVTFVVYTSYYQQLNFISDVRQSINWYKYPLYRLNFRVDIEVFRQDSEIVRSSKTVMFTLSWSHRIIENVKEMKLHTRNLN